MRIIFLNIIHHIKIIKKILFIIYYLNLFQNSIKFNNSIKYLYLSTYDLSNNKYPILNKILTKNIEYINIYHSIYIIHEFTDNSKLSFS